MTDREALEFLEGESGCRPAAHYDERSLKAKAEAEAREKRAKLNAA